MVSKHYGILARFACTSLNTKYSAGCMEVFLDEILENRKLALILGMNASILILRNYCFLNIGGKLWPW